MFHVKHFLGLGAAVFHVKHACTARQVGWR
jgi:hypothetical protein